MASKVVFTEDEQDLLKEIMNIAYGNATAVIADFLDHFATLSIPSFDIYQPPELQKYLQDQCKKYSVYTKQPFNGAFSGETMLFLDEESISNISRCMNITDDENIDNDEIVLELMNILNSTLISRLAEQMDTEVTFTLPVIDKSKSLYDRVPSIVKNYDQVIVIHTLLEFEKEKIKGEIAIFTKDESLVWIHKVVSQMIEALMSE